MNNPIKKMKEKYLNHLKTKESIICGNINQLNEEKDNLFSRLDYLFARYPENYKSIEECQERVRQIEDSMNLIDKDLKKVRRLIKIFS